MTMNDPIPARLAALKVATTPDLKQQWRELFDSEPPPFNRRYLESRLAYRIQELAYGGLKPETIRRLERLGEQLDGGDRKRSRIRADAMPIAGTRLIREWQGVEQVVTVTADGFDWQLKNPPCRTDTGALPKRRGGDEAAAKLIYLALNATSQECKRSGREWHAVKRQFAIMFEDRFPTA